MDWDMRIISFSNSSCLRVDTEWASVSQTWTLSPKGEPETSNWNGVECSVCIYFITSSNPIQFKQAMI